MAVNFKGIIGHIFTEYPSQELNRLGFKSIAVEEQALGQTTHYFPFQDPSGQNCFLSLVQINEEDKFLKSAQTFYPEVVISGRTEVPAIKQAHNVLFSQRPIQQLSNLESAMNNSKLKLLITDLTAEDFNNLALTHFTSETLEFDNQFKIVGNYTGPLFELLKVRKESGAWCLVIEISDANQFSKVSNLPLITWEQRQFHLLKEASINFDILFCLSET